MRRALVPLLLAAMLAGPPLGPAPAAEASHTIRVGVRVTPPVGREEARLTCGWHKSCRAPYDDGRGLDWGVSDDGRRVWYRVRVYTDYYDPPLSLNVAVVQLDADSYGPCLEVIGRTRRVSDRKIMASIRFQHVTRGARRVEDLFGHSRWRLNTITAGTMAAEGPRCPWSGYHAHEWHTNGAVTVARNGDIPRAPSSRRYDRPTRVVTRWMWWSDAAPAGGCFDGWC